MLLPLHREFRMILGNIWKQLEEMLPEDPSARSLPKTAKLRGGHHAGDRNFIYMLGNCGCGHKPNTSVDELI